MHKLLKHLLKSEKKDALNSIDELTNAATDLGYSAHECLICGYKWRSFDADDTCLIAKSMLSNIFIIEI